MSDDTIGLEALRYRLADVLAITEMVTKILETADSETVHEAQGIEDCDCPDFGGNMDDAYTSGVEDGMTLFARELVDLMNKNLEADDGGA